MSQKPEEQEAASSWGLPEADFKLEVERIRKAAAQRGVLLRLVGALAFHLHCPQYCHLQASLGRQFTDIDFASYREHIPEIKKLFSDLGYEEDFMVARLFGQRRLLFYDHANNRHSDVFIDQMEFCHDLPLRGRLEVDPLSLPLAELVVEKMQIVQINEKDIIDTIMLLREHPVGTTDDEVINAKVIAQLCAQEWGLWKTMSINLAKAKEMVKGYEQLDQADKEDVLTKVDELLDYMEKEPKPMKWRMRAKVGERVKWWRDVEELSR